MYRRDQTFCDPVDQFLKDDKDYIGNMDMNPDDPFDIKTNNVQLHEHVMHTTKYGNRTHHEFARFDASKPQFATVLLDPMSIRAVYLEKGVGNYGAPKYQSKDLASASYKVVLDGHAYDEHVVDKTDILKRSRHFLSTLFKLNLLLAWVGSVFLRGDRYACKKKVEFQQECARRKAEIAAEEDPVTKKVLQKQLARYEKEFPAKFLANGTGVVKWSPWKDTDVEYYKDAEGKPLEPIQAPGIPPEIKRDLRVPHSENISLDAPVFYDPNGLADSPQKGKNGKPQAGTKRMPPSTAAVSTPSAPTDDKEAKKEVKDPPKVTCFRYDAATKKYVERPYRRALRPGDVVIPKVHIQGVPDPAPGTDYETNSTGHNKNYNVKIRLLGLIYIDSGRIPRSMGGIKMIERPALVTSEDQLLDIPTVEDDENEAKAMTLYATPESTYTRVSKRPHIETVPDGDTDDPTEVEAQMSPVGASIAADQKRRRIIAAVDADAADTQDPDEM